jgi:hypothetical protein
MGGRWNLGSVTERYVSSLDIKRGTVLVITDIVSAYGTAEAVSRLLQIILQSLLTCCWEGTEDESSSTES